MEKAGKREPLNDALSVFRACEQMTIFRISGVGCSIALHVTLILLDILANTAFQARITKLVRLRADSLC